MTNQTSDSRIPEALGGPSQDEQVPQTDQNISGLDLIPTALGGTYSPQPDIQAAQNYDTLFLTEQGLQPSQSTLFQNNYPGIDGPQPVAGEQIDHLAGWNYLEPWLNEDGIPITPDGTELPPDAVGFDANAKIYWGEGFANYWKGVKYRFNQGANTEFDWEELNYIGESKGEFANPLAAVLDWAQAGFTRAFTPGDATEELAAEQEAGEELVSTVVAGASDIFRILDYGLTDYGGEGNEVGFIQKGGRVVNEVIRGVLAGFETVEEKTEQYYGARVLARKEQAIELGIPQISYPDWTPEWVQVISRMTVGFAANTIAVIEKPGNHWADYRDKVKTNAAASHIAYSAVMDDALRQEFVRRYKEGADPHLLATELANPWHELVGGLVFDPLNLVAPAAKSIRHGWRYAAASADLVRVPKGLRSVFTATDKLNEAQSLAEYRKAANIGIEALQRQRGIVDKTANTRKLWSRTTSSNRHQMSWRTADLFGIMADAVKGDADELGEVMRAFWKLGSDNTDEFADGMLIAGRLNQPELFLGNTGRDMSIIVRSMVDEAADGGVDSVKFFDELSRAQEGGVEGIAKWANQKMQSAIDDTFPTVLEQVARGDDIGIFQRAIARADKVAKDKVYARANQIFANIYMGMSPGYYARNVFSNTFHILADRGIGAFLKKNPHSRVGFGLFNREHLWKEAVSIAGGTHSVPFAAKSGLGGTIAAAEGVASKVGADGAPVGFFKSIKNAEFAQWFSAAGGDAERHAGLVLTVDSMQQTMATVAKKGAMYADDSAIVAAGATPENMKHLQDLMRKHGYNSELALADYRAYAAKGNVPKTHTYAWMGDDEIAEALFKFKWGEEVQEGVSGATTLEDALKRLNEPIDNAFKLVDDELLKTDHVKAGVGAENPRLEEVLAFSDAVKDGHVSDGAQAVTQNRIAYTQQAMTGYKDVASDMYANAQNLFSNGNISQAQWDEVQALRNSPEFQQYVTGTYNASITGTGQVNTARQIDKKNWLYSLNSSDEIRAALNIPTGQSADFGDVWTILDISDVPPPHLTKDIVVKNLWDKWRGDVKQMWSGALSTQKMQSLEFVDRLQKILPELTTPHSLSVAEEAFQNARLLNETEWTRTGLTYLGEALGRAIKKDDSAQAIRTIANQFNIGTISKNGGHYDSHIMSVLNQYSDKGLVALDDIDIDKLDEIVDIFNARNRAKGWPELRIELDPNAIPAKTVWPAWDQTSTPSMVRALHDQRNGIRDMQAVLQQRLRDNWGQMTHANLDDGIETALTDWQKLTDARVTQARAIAGRVATGVRNFALHDYADRRNFDLMWSYVMPYNFWYSRTYKNWMSRVVMNSDTVAAFSKYQTYMEDIHAGAPEWWKYNINTNELFGYDSDNPLYFNLMATLNPMNGLTGVDFSDPDRRVDWSTRMLDDLNKFGPSIWTPISLVVAYNLHARGEQDASARWAGQFFPQTKFIRSIGAVANIDALANIQDPLTRMFSGGLDPYEAPRVTRALGAMVSEGLITEEQSIDISRKKEGEVWDEAVRRALDSRAPGNISSFLLGAGFKARNEQDMEIDRFYQHYRNLWVNEPNMSTDEFRAAMDGLHQRYPFMDTLLVGRGAGPEQDKGLAYNVLGRIPPGQMSEISELIGIDERLLSKFYETKGHMEEWPETERMQFMSAVIDMSMIFQLPEDATREEWTAARNQYTKLQAEGERLYGDDIWDLIDVYYARKGADESGELAKAYLEANPIVEEAMDWQTGIKYNDPTLFKYYGGIDFAERYWKGQMYQAIDDELGNMDALWDEYSRLADIADATGTKADRQAKSAYWRANPEFSRYMEIRDEWTEKIQAQLDWMGPQIVSVAPEIREDIGDIPQQSFSQQDALQQLAPEQAALPTAAEWQTLFSPTQWNLLSDLLIDDKDYPEDLVDDIEAIAAANGMTYDQMLDLIEQSLLTQ